MHTNGKVESHVSEPYSLLKLDQQAFHGLWALFIRPGLERIKEKSEGGFWEAEHVFQRIMLGYKGTITCEPWVILSASQPVGFIITQVYNDEWLQVPTHLHVWMGWCERAPLKKVIPYILPTLEARAVELGLRGIRGISPRVQWIRRLAEHGFRVEQYIFEKRLA